MKKLAALASLCATLSTIATASTPNEYTELSSHQYAHQPTANSKLLDNVWNVRPEFVHPPQNGEKFISEDVDVHLPPPEDDKQKIA